MLLNSYKQHLEVFDIKSSQFLKGKNFLYLYLIKLGHVYLLVIKKREEESKGTCVKKMGFCRSNILFFLPEQKFLNSWTEAALSSWL